MSATHAVASVVAAAIVSSPALAAETLIVNLVPESTTLFIGHTMIIHVFADYSGVSSGQSIAGWKFDVIGSPNGVMSGDVNNAVFSNGVNNGTPSGGNLLDFAGGQLPLNLGGGNTTNYLGSFAYTDLGLDPLYTVTLGITDYAAPTGALNVYINGSGAQSRAYFPTPPIGGANHQVIVNSTPFHVVFPAPSAAAPLALMLLAARRRR